MEKPSKYIKIAELSEAIDKLNVIIKLHSETTQNESMILQYQLKKDELITELQELLSTLGLQLSKAV